MCVWCIPCTKHGVAGLTAAEGVGPEPAMLVAASPSNSGFFKLPVCVFYKSGCLFFISTAGIILNSTYVEIIFVSYIFVIQRDSMYLPLSWFQAS